MKMCFLTPENNLIPLNYYDVLDYCKNICLSDEYKDQFSEFSKDYSYFNGYFDFVVFNLGYAIANPLFNKKKIALPIGDAMYSYDIDSLDYRTLMDKALLDLDYYGKLSILTKTSDCELGINKKDGLPNDELIDCNLVGMMSSTGSIFGSHSITGNTILNQLLISDKEICLNYYHYINNYGIDSDVDALNYLTSNMGFLRTSADSAYPLIISSDTSINNKQKEYIKYCEENGYSTFYVDEFQKDLKSNYQKVLKK